MLAAAFDRMLERLERAFNRQRDFVSDASHELRTPLSVLRAQVELLDRETDERSRHEGTTTSAAPPRRARPARRRHAHAGERRGRPADRAADDRPDDFFEDLRRDLPLFGERDFRLQAVDGHPRGRSRPADPGAAQPRPQRGRAYRAPAIGVEVFGPGPRRRSARDLGQRHGTRHPVRGARADLRAISPRSISSRSRDSGGSGLGLAIARAIVEAHGGTIRAEFISGHGATLRIKLPGYRAPESSRPKVGSASL